MNLYQVLTGKTVFKKPAQKLTYMYLMSYIGCDKIFPSVGTIAEATCQTTRNVTRVIEELEFLGLLEVKREKGKSNLYTVIPYDTVYEIETPDKMSPPTTDKLSQVKGEVATNCPDPTDKMSEEVATNCHTTNNLLVLKNNSNSSRLDYIHSLVKEYPNIPVSEIAEELENDESVEIKTDKQFMGLLSYRVKNYRFPSKRKGKVTSQPTRTEFIPDWFNQPEKPVEMTEELKAKKEALEKKLAKYKEAK